MKKIISVFLAVLMIAGCFGMMLSASAVDTVFVLVDRAGYGDGEVSGSGSYALTARESSTHINLGFVVNISNAEARPAENSKFDGWYADAECTQKLATDRQGHPLLDYTQREGMTILSSDTEPTVRIYGKLVRRYYLEVTVNKEGEGTVTGGGTFEFGEVPETVIHAEPAEGYTFEGWYCGDNKVSDKPDHTVIVDGTAYNLTYTAKFVKKEAPADPEPQPENLCKWCGQVHEGFFGAIVGFFHRILAAIFGAKY